MAVSLIRYGFTNDTSNVSIQDSYKSSIQSKNKRAEKTPVLKSISFSSIIKTNSNETSYLCDSFALSKPDTPIAMSLRAKTKFTFAGTKIDDISKNPEYKKLAKEIGITQPQPEKVPDIIKDELDKAKKIQGSSPNVKPEITLAERISISNNMKNLAIKHKELTEKLADTQLPKTEREIIMKKLADITAQSTKILSETPLTK